MEVSTPATQKDEVPFSPQPEDRTQRPNQGALDEQTPKLPLVTIDYQGLEREGKWRLEQVFQLWCEWYESAYPSLQVDHRHKPLGNDLSSGKMGYDYTVGRFVAEEQRPAVEDCMQPGESLMFNLEYEQRYETIPQYDRAREAMPMQRAVQDAPPPHHIAPRCFNCGSYNHGVRGCKREHSQSNISKNRASYAGPIGSFRGSGRGRGERVEARNSGRRESREFSGMKRFLPRDDRMVEDRDTPNTSSWRHHRDKTPRNASDSWDQERQFRPTSKGKDYPDNISSRPEGEYDTGFSKKSKIGEAPTAAVPLENIIISLDESTEEGEVSDEEGEETDSMDDVIIITRGGVPKSEPLPVKQYPTDDKIPGLCSPAHKAPDVSLKLENGETELRELEVELTEEATGRDESLVQEDSPLAVAPVLMSMTVMEIAVCEEPKAEPVTESTAPDAHRTHPPASRDEEKRTSSVELKNAWNETDKEEGELDVEEGEIVENQEEPKPGMFVPSPTRRRSESPGEWQRTAMKSNGPRLPGSAGQGSYMCRGHPSRFARHNRPPARRLAQGTMQSIPPQSTATAASAAAVAGKSTGWAPVQHRPSQHVGQHKPSESRMVQPPFAQPSGIANSASNALHGAHQPHMTTGNYEAMIAKSSNSGIVPRLNGSGPHYCGPNSQNSAPVSSGNSVEQQHLANITGHQFRNAQFVPQKVMMQRGLVGQQQPVISRNPQIVGNKSLQGFLQHPFQSAQQPYVHFHSHGNLQPGMIGWQQEHHSQAGEGFVGTGNRVPNSQIHYQTQPHHHQQQQHQNFAPPQQQLVQVGTNMVILSPNGQQMVVKHTNM